MGFATRIGQNKYNLVTEFFAIKSLSRYKYKTDVIRYDLWLGNKHNKTHNTTSKKLMIKYISYTL